jgi:arylsulfatase A-like enzyme
VSTARPTAALACAALAPLLALAACSRGPEPYAGPVRTLVVISLDTLRADHLGAYGGDVGTPTLDRLAAEGVTFEDVTTAAPTTLASHVSLLTGTWPHTHGVPRNGFTVAAENLTLAELLAERGFATAAFVGSFALDRRFGIDQGFEHFDQEFDALADFRARDQDQRRAPAVTDAALAWLDGADADERRLVFVHYFDAHAPYDSPDAGASRATYDDLRAAVVAQHARLLGGTPPEDALERTILSGLSRDLLERADGVELATDRALAEAYAAEVRVLDREVGRLVDGLERRGLLDGAVIAVVADHGESFHEHADFWNHGLWAWQTTAHVPWILWRAPDLRAAGEAGRRVSEPVSTIDVLPTLCGLLGLDVPGRVEGVDLSPAVVRGAALARGAVFCEATQPPLGEQGGWANRSKAAAVREGSLKLIEAPAVPWLGCYDLASDPGETLDLCADGLDPRFARLRRLLAEFRASARPLPSSVDASQLEETLRRLQGLGYPEGAPGTGERR